MAVGACLGAGGDVMCLYVCMIELRVLVWVMKIMYGI